MYVQKQTETENGTETIGYWLCTECGQAFADAAGTQPYTGETIGIGFGS